MPEWEWRLWDTILEEEGFKIRKTPDGNERITPGGTRIQGPDLLVAAGVLHKRKPGKNSKPQFKIVNYNLWEDLVDCLMEN